MSSNLIVNNIEVGAGATIYTASSNTLTFGTNGSEKVRITSAGLVGIGTNNPNEDLHIASNSPYIKLQDYDNNRSWRIKGTAWFAIEDITAGTDRLRISSTGNVSIGDNVTPDTLLHIQGDQPKLRIESTNALSASAGTEEIARIEFEATKGSNLNVAASMRVRQDGTWSTVDDWFSPTAIEFYTQDQSGSEITTPRLTIASDGDVIIGGTDAGYPNFADNLTIHDTQHSGITIRSGIASQGAIYFSDATGSGAGTYVGNIIYDHSDNHMRFATSGTERVRIHQDGWCMLNTSTLGNNKNAKELVVSYNNTGIGGGDQGRAGITIRSGQNTSSVSQPGYLYFSDGTAGSNEGIGGITYDHSNDKMHFTTGGYERLGITSDGVIQTPGTSKIKPHSVGIGTTATTNTGVGTAYGEMMYNTTDDKLQIYTKSNKWYNVHNWTDSVEGYYTSTTAASADGLNHYWPGNSSNSLISNLVPNDTSNSPVINLTVDSYHGTYPYFNFYSGNNELGWRFTKGGTKWGNGPFTIAFWVRPQASNLESESTFVQLGSHSGTRSLYTVSTDGSRKLKAITIGDDTGVHSSATLSTGWQHVVVTYETNRNTKYYINGSNVRTFNHSSNLDVGTGTQYIYIGYGYWNSTSSNKACMSQMSDIGIWDSDALTATEISNLYNAKRIIAGY